MATADPDDPRLWDEDRVVLEVCTKPISIFSRVPNRDRLEQPLRENNITGEFLLELDVHTLKVDLGVSSLGQRKAIMKGIDLLRPRPAPFTMEERVRMYREGLETPEITHPRLSLPASVNEPRLSIEQEIAQTTSIHPNQQIKSSGFAPMLYEGHFGMAAPRQPMNLLRQGITPLHAESVPDNDEDSAMLIDQRLPGFTSAAQVTKFQEGRRSDQLLQPHLQTGVEGRIFDSPIVGRGTVQNSPHQPLVVSSQPRIEQTSLPKPKKRIAPTFIAHLQKPKPVPSLDILERLNDHSYLGFDTLPIQDTFYGSDLETDDETFEMVSSKKAAGYRRAVAGRMLHYLRSSPVPVPNTKMVARLPYTSEQCFGPSSEHLFTLMAPNASPIVQRVDNWPSLSNRQLPPIRRTRSNMHSHTPNNNKFDTDIGAVDDAFALPAEASNNPANLGDFAYLLEKYPAQPVEDEGLPLYGESDDENGYDDETWNEMEAEKAEIVRSKNVMSTVEVASAVEAAIVDFEQEWKANKLLKVEAKAYQLWTKVASLRMRQPERNVINGTLRRCEGRLVKLKDAIISDVWNKSSDVKAQCHSMEETVNTILECHHMLKVLERDTAPPKPDRRALKNDKPRIELPEGEELLDSDDDIDTFIVDDSSSAEDIPFAAEADFNPILCAPSEPQQQDRTPQDLSVTESTPEVRIASDPNPPENTGDEADVESDSEDRILSPSQKRRRSGLSKTPRKSNNSTDEATDELDPISSNDSQTDSDLDAPPRLPKSKYRSRGQSETQAIDLTFSDPLEPMNDTNSSEFDVRTPPLNPAATAHPKLESSESVNRGYGEKLTPKGQTKKSPVFRVEHQLPMTDNVVGIRKLDWLAIENDSDRIRALCKGVYGLEESEFNAFHAYINTRAFTPHDQRLEDDLTWLRYPDNTERKVSAKHQASVKLLCLLFMTFVCYKDIVSTRKPSQSDFNTSYDGAEPASKSFFQQLKQACDIYHDFLRATAKTGRRGTKRKSPSSDLEDSIVSDMDSDVIAPGEAPEHSQTYKKRKRVVKESREVKVQQKTDQQRVREQELRRQAMETKFKSMHKDDGKVDHYVNFQEPFILLDPHIARRAMPHQIDGIRFLWREIIEDPKHQGCLLAHTMGLGKTMQVISLLATIAQCNQSERSEVRARIPVHLRQSQTLILCPPSLLDNWYDELLMWLPRPALLGTIHKIGSSKDDGVTRWASDGGVLLISYSLFRKMLVPTERTPTSEAVLAEREIWLLKKASMVIADEAHQMKNADSKLTGAARRFQTKSRIAMTGSPLNNNLKEYHTLVDWIAPGYLGTALNFNTKYVEPITLGLYKDSTPYEHRVSKKKLHVLKQDLAPKVNRADISAISKELPSKTEYLITLPLTDLQRQAYDIYVGHMIQQYGTSGPTVKKGLFSLIAILSSLCNHPSIFVKKFNKQRNREPIMETGEQPDAGAIDSDSGTSPGIDSPAEIDSPSATRCDLVAMEKAVMVFENAQTMGGMNDIRLSYRAAIVQQILHRSIDRGDKTLLFSHSLDVLDYLETLLKQIQCEYMRIDGSTKVDQRQNITKRFNRHDSPFRVCLVSTKAGGLGLNFQGASRIIIFDFGFNPMWEEQAVGRAYRLGQKQPVHVYRFRTGGTIDEIIHNKAVFKTQLFSRVVDKKSPIRYASNNVADYLFLSRDVEQQDFDECKGTDPGVLDDIIAESDQIRKIELDETFHKEDGEELNEEELKEANEEYDRQRLQRDDPVAYTQKYGAQIPGQGLFGTQSPAFLAGSVSQAAPNTGGSDSVKKARGRPPGKAVERPSDVMTRIATPMSNTDRHLGAYMPTASMATQAFDQNLIFNRQTAPSPPSGAPSPSTKDVPPPGGNPGDVNASALNTPGCEQQ